MRAVMVVVLPEVPADDDADDALSAQMRAVASALDIPETKGGRLIVTIREVAEAVLRTAEDGS